MLIYMFLLYLAVYFNSVLALHPYPQFGILLEELLKDSVVVNLPLTAWTTFKHFSHKPYKLIII